MNLPRQLQEMNVFANGKPLTGQCQTFTRPKLVMKTEEYLAGGLGAPVKLQTGSLEALEATHKYGGEIPELNAGFGSPTLDGQLLRFAGAYQNNATGSFDDVQIFIRGATNEIDVGDDEVGAKSGATYKTDATYYRQVRNSVVEFEIDILARKLVVFGVDRWAEIRRITR